MPGAKRFTDISVGFSSLGMLLLHPADLKKIDAESEEIKDIAENCHIYLIVSRPRAFYVPGSVRYVRGKISGKLRYNINGKVKVVKFVLPVGSGLTIKPVAYPYVNLKFFHGAEDKWFGVPAHLMSLYADLNDSLLKSADVVYVGMSYADGKRAAKDRLVSHSTLQAVMADMARDEPDRETLLIMAEYDSPRVMMVLNGAGPDVDIADDRDVEADLNQLQASVSKDLQTALVEAGLIKYFQPRYNEKYKYRFPHPTHEILTELYGLDISAISVEINTEIVKLKLASETRNSGYHHVASYDLHDPKARQSFFNIMNIVDGANALTFSGPVY